MSAPQGVLTELSEPAIVASVEANPIEWFLHFMPHVPGSEVVETDEYIRFETGMPSPLFNGFMRPLLRPETAAETVRDLTDHFRARDLPMSCWIGPGCRPDNLQELLEQNGLHAHGDTPCMAMDLGALDEERFGPPSLQVDEALTQADMDDVTVPLRAGFEMPESITDVLRDTSWRIGVGPGARLRHFVGRMEGKPVSCASLFLGAGVVGIYSVATTPEARRQGVAADVVSACLRTGREAGYRFAILHASEMGYRVYERLGFREYCKMRMHAWSPEELQA